MEQAFYLNENFSDIKNYFVGIKIYQLLTSLLSLIC